MDAAEIQADLRRLHGELAEADPPSLDGRRLAVLAATRTLTGVNRASGASAGLIYAIAGAAAVAMLVEVGLMAAERVSWWYLFAVVPVGAGAGVIAGLEHDQPAGRDRLRVGAAILFLLAAALVAIVAAGVFGAPALWLLVPLLAGAGGGWFAGSRYRASRSGAGAAR